MGGAVAADEELLGKIVTISEKAKNSRYYSHDALSGDKQCFIATKE